MLQGADRGVYPRVRRTTRKECEWEVHDEVDQARMTAHVHDLPE